MLTFFRRIRRAFLESGSTRKYLLYAVGEIALVVIGILIALQINNWNEGLKSRSFELKMLTEIRQSLSRDTAYFHMLTRRLTRIDTSTQRILSLLIYNVNDKSLFSHHLWNIDIPYTFMYEDGAYEALKASGIENVSNNTLRQHLINHYGFEMPRWVKLMGMYRRDSHLKLAEDLEWELFSFQPDADNGRLEINKLELKPDVIGSDTFYRYINLKQRDAANGLRLLETIINNSNSLSKHLDEELDNSEK